MRKQDTILFYLGTYVLMMIIMVVRLDLISSGEGEKEEK